MARPEEFGTVADGTVVRDYCSDCLVAGHFTGPAASRDDLRRRLGAYLRRDVGLADDEARTRADELASIVGGPAGRLVVATLGVTHSWWALVLRGVLAVLAGVLFLFWPGLSLAGFVLAFAVWALVDGVLALGAGLGGRSWQLAIIGVLGIAAGLLTFWQPGATALALYAIAAAWAITRGVLEIAAAIDLRKYVGGAWWFAVAGIFSIAFGVLLIALPQAGMLALAWLIGVYALVFGASLIALGVQVRRFRKLREERRSLRPVYAP